MHVKSNLQTTEQFIKLHKNVNLTMKIVKLFSVKLQKNTMEV